MSKNNVTISGHHVEVTPALEKTINDMLHKLQHKFDHITTVHVTLKIDSIHPHLQQAEAELYLCGKKEPLFAKATSADMYDSLHKLRDKLDRQIVKHKEVLKMHGDHNHNHSHDHHGHDHKHDFDEDNNSQE